MDDSPELAALKRSIERALSALPKKRDFYDRQLQAKLSTKGKPIYDIQRGKVKNPGVATRRAIAEVLGIPAAELLQPGVASTSLHPTQIDRPGSAVAAANDDDIVEIISLDLSLSMGPGTLIEEFVEEEPVHMGLAFVRSITRTPTDRLRLVKGIGDSMEPTLRSSDRVMIDINERQLSRINGIYWIDHLGLHGIKRLRAAGRGRVMIGSDNPNVEDFDVASDELRIEGRAIWFGREL